ncbi:MAG: AGE family epimerase/isomerase [Spirochaetes bacterium]|nr:AGE family epimerase/isomerase [Spirochaetota bacterium]
MKSWIRQVCLDWIENLPRTKGGHAESVSERWKEGPETVRTMLTQARIVYTFLRCCPEDAISVESLDRLVRLFWDEAAKGWIRSCTLEGVPLDRTIDTYDQPFGLLALAEAYRTCLNGRALNLIRKGTEIQTVSAAIKELAYATLEGLDQFARDRFGGGYWERRNGTVPSPLVLYPEYRRQNPHMHLLEAFLAWDEVDPQGPWMDHAQEILHLFRTRFRSTESGTLAEYFDDRWNLAPEEAGRIREPGHQYEWVWLLDWYEQRSGDSSVRADGEVLYRFAQGKGTDPVDGLAYAIVEDTGLVRDDRKLLWPQTEMVKAHVVMYRWTGDIRYKRAALGAYQTIQERFIRPHHSIFYNRLDRLGVPDPAPALTRLLYHLYGGMEMGESLCDGE